MPRLSAASTTPLSRRAALLGTPAIVAASSLAGRAAWSQGQAGGSATPFTLGVASGEPVPGGFVIWTRLAPAPLAGGGMPPADLPLRWEVAEDEHFSRIAARGEETARADEAHSVHVEVAGLRAGRWYWYRFIAGGAASPVGRTRTAPAPGDSPERLRLVLASCQNWEHGYFHPWRHAAAEDADAICFVGDYIYEYGANPRRPLQARPHQDWAAVSLAQYRDRYALYKTDTDLQVAHAAAPWILTWDDHEVVNDYAADRPEVLAQQPAFLARRAAAYQAFWEHTPMRRAHKPAGPDATIYRQLGWGQLARLHVVDDRQYRDYQSCPKPELGGGSTTVGADCADRLRPDRTMMGTTQERWLADGLRASDSRWNLLVQQTLLAPFNQGTAAAPRWWTDAWDGYPAARGRLLRTLVDHRVRNPLVLGGDVHCFYATDIPSGGPGGPGEGPLVATEFVGSSISSRGWTREQIGRFLPQNPHIRFADPERRGYAVLDIAPTRTDVRFRAVLDPLNPGSAAETLAKFAVLNGTPGVQPA